jgi:hypothetical protein
MAAWIVDSQQSLELCGSRRQVGVALKGCSLATQPDGYSAVACTDSGFGTTTDECGPSSNLGSEWSNMLQFYRLSPIPNGRV